MSRGHSVLSDASPMLNGRRLHRVVGRRAGAARGPVRFGLASGLRFERSHGPPIGKCDLQQKRVQRSVLGAHRFHGDDLAYGSLKVVASHVRKAAISGAPISDGCRFR
jgi:hypothetical protein